MAITGNSAVTINPADHGLKQHEMKTSTVVFMVFCLCAAGAYGIEEMIPQAGPGLTLVMLIVLPFLWSTPMGLVAAELGSALPQEGGYYTVYNCIHGRNRCVASFAGGAAKARAPEAAASADNAAAPPPNTSRLDKLARCSLHFLLLIDSFPQAGFAKPTPIRAI